MNNHIKLICMQKILLKKKKRKQTWVGPAVWGILIWSVIKIFYQEGGLIQISS